MVNHPPKGSVQYHSNRGYLRQSSRLKVNQFIVLLRLKMFYFYNTQDAPLVLSYVRHTAYTQY